MVLKDLEQVQWPDGLDVEGTIDGSVVLDPTAVRSALKANREALSKLEDALRRPRFQFPEASWEDSPRLKDLRPLFSLACLRYRLALEEEGPAEAIVQLTQLLRWGHVMEGGDGPFYAYLRGLSFKWICLEEVPRLLESPVLSETDLHALMEEVRRWAPLDDGLSRSIRVEYGMGRRSIFRLAEQHPLFLIHPERTRRHLAGIFRAVLASAERARMDHPGLEAMAEIEVPVEQPGSLSWLPPRNHLGWVLVHTIAPSKGPLHSFLRLRLLHRKTLLLLALKLHVLREGRLPESLDALVPRHLGAVPIDPYDGQPLRYSAERKLIWSVGDDLQDSGGDGASETDEREPTFPIPF